MADKIGKGGFCFAEQFTDGKDILMYRLNELYTEYKAKKYVVAVFESGSGDLYENTRDLLLLNQRRTAEKSVQQEKKQRMTEMKH